MLMLLANIAGIVITISLIGSGSILLFVTARETLAALRWRYWWWRWRRSQRTQTVARRWQRRRQGQMAGQMATRRQG